MNMDVKENIRKRLNRALRSKYDVLIVDDNQEQANLTKLLIEEYGFKAQFLTDSSKALEKIQSDQPSVVILDLMMPELDGLRLCRQIKTSKDTYKTKVIIYSGKMYDSDRRKAIQFGADAFFVKPTRANRLISKIKELLPSTTYQNEPCHN
ncbi:MAG: response regulator [Calditrichaeota bacterium]|nr:MAG: response regulator [Calditrichota bacterium]